VSIEAGVGVSQVEKTPDQQASTGKQHERQRHL
jgi:hypothetical protein